MRVAPRIGTKLWFGPRDGGWGWQPECREGWLAAFAVLLGYLVSAALSFRSLAGFVVGCTVTSVCMLLVGSLKGTAPGGSSARREFEALLRAHNAPRLDPRRLPPR